MPSISKTHWGGHLGVIGLTTMLLFTSCVTVSEQSYEGGLAWLPAWAQGGGADTADAPPNQLAAQARQINPARAQFIVRFADEPLLGDVGKSFRRDPKSARASYRRWQEQHPEMQGIELVRASYSGELILALPEDDTLGRNPQDVLDALTAMDTLVYAELDSTAKPSQ